MRLRPALLPLLGAVLLSSGAALAKKPVEFQAPQQMSEEEIAAAKERSKNRLNGYDEKMEERPTCLPWAKNAPNCIPFPWAALGLAGLSFLVAAPFGLRAFRQTSRELTGADSALGGARRGSAED